MNKSRRYALFSLYLISSIALFVLIVTLILQITWLQLLKDWTFILTFIFYVLTIEESVQWVRNGKRSEMSDIIAIVFIFFLMFFFSKDILTSIMGAFSIYLWIGIFELKDYPILNKILLISLVTYNVIFVAGIFSFYLDNPFFINTSFAFSFWIILIMGFILFGRKYIIVWRFLSPEYLTLFIYIIAWLAVVFITEYTPIDLITTNPLISNANFLVNFFLNIYFILILVNWVIYFVSGGILDKLLGIKKVDNSELIKLVEDVKEKIGIKSKVKIGFGQYPILNAMAYGSVFDKRIALIAEDINQIPEDELRGIVAHELAHTKGRHTLLLTVITTIDLIVRMFLGIPATFYDYTFGNPQIPLLGFIILNILIYIVLFIFVRILEARADLRAKVSGYGEDLVKALYNLESFYATGREIGFNTMLLSEEKITKENQLLDFLNTAFYLYHSMIKPSKASLIGSFLNSHPPSYFRIAAIFNNKLKPTKEAILPFICLKKSKQKKYAQMFELSRQAFITIANRKFKEFFNINDVSVLLQNLRRKDLFKYDLHKDYIFRNKITEDIIVGTLNEIKFKDNVCSTDILSITNIKTQEEEDLESSKYVKSQIDLNELYYLQRNTQLFLKEINLDNQKENRFFVFLDENGNHVKKQIQKTKLPNSVRVVRNLENCDIFFKDKGKLKVLKCINVSNANNFLDIELSFSNGRKTSNHELLKYNIKELIIRPRKIYLPISKDIQIRESEVNGINWLIRHKILVHLYIKKPVNNYERGWIQSLEVNLDKFNKKSKNKEKENNDYLKMRNIFEKEITIPYKEIESIGFEYNSALIQLKRSTSFTSRLGYRILKKFKPDRIIMT